MASSSSSLTNKRSKSSESSSEQTDRDTTEAYDGIKLGWSKFTRTLFEMASSEENTLAVGFSADGNCLEIRNAGILKRQVLPKYFKHQNASSFTRQLNNYGFRTIGNSTSPNGVQVFQHPSFRVGRPDLLCKVVRRGSNKGIDKKTSKLHQEVLHHIQTEDELQRELSNLQVQNQRLLLARKSLLEENAQLKTKVTLKKETIAHSHLLQNNSHGIGSGIHNFQQLPSNGSSQLSLNDSSTREGIIDRHLMSNILHGSTSMDSAQFYGRDHGSMDSPQMPLFRFILNSNPSGPPDNTSAFREPQQRMNLSSFGKGDGHL